MEEVVVDPVDLMARVVALAAERAAAGHGPFAAAVVRDGKLVCLEANQVLASYDPTAHAEVTAIRSACAILKTNDLSGCEVYTSCYPCPMCFAAMYWANVASCRYAATSTDAAVVGGFDDAFIYEEIAKGEAERRVVFGRVDVGEQRLAPFRAFHAAQQQAGARVAATAAAGSTTAPPAAAAAASASTSTAPLAASTDAGAAGGAASSGDAAAASGGTA